MTGPVVLFACVHNGGRSLAAKVLAEHHAGGRLDVRSAGSAPGDSLDPTVVQVLHERGLSTEGEAPTLLTVDGVREADVVVTMGCGETCPVVPGKAYEDWPLDDPRGQDLDTVRRIVDEVDARVRDLLGRLAPRARARRPEPLLRPRKATAGDKVAVLSPSFAAPAVAPQVHEQALGRLRELTGLVPVEYPTTRRLGASAQDRAADLDAAFADPEIRAVLATIGGEDQITVVPHLDPELVRADPKPFLGYSDNTNLLNALWTSGVAGFYGGSTQVHLGPGPGVDAVHLRSLRAALLTGERLELTEPGESEDIGKDWQDPAALVEHGDREPTEPWTWAGPARSVTGPTWGGCAEVLQWILAAGRFPADPDVLAGGVLLLETSEELITARELGWIVRLLGERGMLAAVDAVLVARPPTSTFEVRPSPSERAARRAEQRDVAIATVQRYNPDAVIVVGVPFGHTRPQWIVPYGGMVTVDGAAQRLWADYS